MGDHPRKAAGRRVFSTEFKRTTVQRILSGEKRLAELSRELDISPSVIRTWKRFAESGATTAVQASEDVVPASQLREAYAKIRELERALGRKTMENAILRAAQEVVKKRRLCAERPGGDRPHYDGDLCRPPDRATHRLLHRASPSGRPAASRGGRPRAAADPRGDQQPGDVWLSPRVGDGQPDIPDALQSQTHSARDAAPRANADAARPPSPRPAAPRADPTAGLESALVLRRLPDPVLERRGHLRGLRD